MHGISKGRAAGSAGTLPAIWGAMAAAEQMCSALGFIYGPSRDNIAAAIIAEELAGIVAHVHVEPAA